LQTITVICTVQSAGQGIPRKYSVKTMTIKCVSLNLKKGSKIAELVAYLCETMMSQARMTNQYKSTGSLQAQS